MGVWKRKGKAGGGSYWTSIAVHGGRATYSDICLHVAEKKGAEEVERKVRRLVAAKAGGEPPPSDLAPWVEAMPQRLRERLIAVGVLDAARAALGKTIAEHVTDYIRQCDHDGQDAVHTAHKASQLRKLIDATGPRGSMTCGPMLWGSSCKASSGRAGAIARSTSTGPRR